MAAIKLIRSRCTLLQVINKELISSSGDCEEKRHEEIVKEQKRRMAYLIYTSAEDGVPLLVPLECKYGPFVLPQGARQIP